MITQTNTRQDQNHSNIKAQLGHGGINVISQRRHAKNAKDRALAHDDLPSGRDRRPETVQTGAGPYRRRKD